MARRLLASFMVVPAPTGPTWNVARPELVEQRQAARHRVVVAADHEHQAAVLGADGSAGERCLHEVVAAGGQLARRWPGCSRAASWTARAGSTRAQPRWPTPSATAVTTVGLGSDVSVISLAAATSATDSTALAPSMAVARAGSRSVTVTSWPSATTLLAIPPPMFPSPDDPHSRHGGHHAGKMTRVSDTRRGHAGRRRQRPRHRRLLGHRGRPRSAAGRARRHRRHRRPAARPAGRGARAVPAAHARSRGCTPPTSATPTRAEALALQAWDDARRARRPRQQRRHPEAPRRAGASPSTRSTRPCG